ncbi:hypothetical protein QTP88_006500 [Uroleucon formosanum]
MAQAIGVLATIKNVKFVIHLFILREVLKIVNILSVQLQAKSATLELKRSRKEPRYHQDFDVTTVTGSDDDLIRTKDVKSYWKINAFFPMLDVIIINMKKRFSAESFQIKLFYIDLNAPKSEMMVVKNCVLRSSIELQIDFDKIKEVLQSEIYLNLYTLLKVAFSIPVSSATCERSFSTMRRIKN